MNQAILSVILEENQLSYWLCDTNLYVLDMGGKVALSKALSDQSLDSTASHHLLAWLPELEGMEETLGQIAAGRLPRLDLPRLTRTVSENDVQYLDLQLVHVTEVQVGIKGVLALLRDVTPQGKVEQALMQQRNELTLLRDQLKQKNQELAALNLELRLMNNLKTSLVNLVAHELRTPLTGLIGRIELLMDRSPDWGNAELQIDLEQIYSEAQRMAQAVQNLTEAIRLETDRVELFLIPADPIATLSGVIDRIQPSLAARSAQVKLHLPGDELPDMLCDRRKAHQLLAQLFGLVTRYSRTGSTIHVKPLLQSNFIEIQIVSESMKDFSRDAPPSSFGFPNIEDTNNRWTNVDTALSLYIVRSLIELHGGYFEVRPRNNGDKPMVIVAFPALGKVKMDRNTK